MVKTYFSFAKAEQKYGEFDLDYRFLKRPEQAGQSKLSVESSRPTPAQSYLWDSTPEYHPLDVDDKFNREFKSKEGYEEIIYAQGLFDYEIKGIKPPQVGQLSNGSLYIFNHPDKKMVELEITDQVCKQLRTDTISRHIYFVLDPKKYGFDNTHILQYHKKEDVRKKWAQIQVDGKKLELNKLSNEKLDDLYSKNEMTVNTFLDTIGKIVNDSMEYDKDSLYSVLTEIAHKRGIADDVLNKELEELKARDSTNPQATISGVCRNSGFMIRSILQSIELNDDRYLWAQTSGLIEGPIPGYHDYTLFVDRKTGHWALINSKTTRNSMNLVPKEQLAECGLPFSNIA